MLRQVSDCSATFKATLKATVNHLLLQGPNLSSTLLGILLKFRQEPVAVVLPFQIMLQELCRRNFGWDETKPQDILHQWTRWLKDVDVLSKFKVEGASNLRALDIPYMLSFTNCLVFV